MRKRLQGILSLLKLQIAQSIPLSVYRPMLRRAFGDNMVALCLHRVAEQHRRTDPYPANTFVEGQLLELLDLLYGQLGSRLIITFDDGYLDAIEFVETHSARYPKAEFILFLCPEKLVSKRGYRWDLVELRDQPKSQLAHIHSNLDIRTENQRLDLEEVYRDSRFSLASVKRIVQVGRLANVSLGNHSNCHFNFAKLSQKDWQLELHNSFNLFEQHFGKTEHFAFPFGTPVSQFLPEQARFIEECYGVKVWSTAGGVNPISGRPLFYNRYALAGHQPLKRQLFIMCRNNQLPPKADVPPAKAS